MKNAVKSFFRREKEEIHALTDVSFTVEDGEMVGYIGPNGAGKSTTIKIMCGVLTPDSGQCGFRSVGFCGCHGFCHVDVYITVLYHFTERDTDYCDSRYYFFIGQSCSTSVLSGKGTSGGENAAFCGHAEHAAADFLREYHRSCGV